MAVIDTSRKTVPRKRKDWIRRRMPIRTPAIERRARISASHGALATPLMKMSAV